MNAPTHAPRLSIRRMSFSFGSPIPRHWLHGDPTRTHLLDGMGLLFPRLEDFLIRVAREADGKLGGDAAPELRAFIAQEAQHLAHHRKVFDHLRGHGYAIDSFLERFDRIVDRLDRLDYPTRLAIAAAGEHFTAIGSAHLLRRSFVRGGHPELAALFAWHWAEEIEHKAVLFDVMVGEDVGLRRKLVGVGVAFALIPFGIIVSMLKLLAEDGILFEPSTSRELVRLHFTDEALVPMIVRGAREFLRGDFHPDDHDDASLAAAVLASDDVRAFERVRTA